MRSEIVVICKCPGCERIYRQVAKGEWEGVRRRMRSGELALRARCHENGQSDDGKPWIGYAYCSECALLKMPPALRGAVGDWLRQGEQL